jgi:hypothetical protein
MEDPTKGTEFDMTPKETDPNADYLAAKGIALECLDSTTIRGDSGVMKFKDTAVTTEVSLEDLASGGNGISPGYIFGRAAFNSAGDWLRSPGGVASNKSAVPVNVVDPVIVRVSSGTEDLNTYTIEVYEHDGDSINLTLLTSLSVTASRTGDSGDISVAATQGKQLAVKISSGTARNITTQVVIKGTTS